MSDPKDLRSVHDIQLDVASANLGTPRGLELLEESINACGVGRSVLVDRNGIVVSGNKTVQVALARGTPIEVIQTDGQELVVVQRTDLDLMVDPRARKLAYYDNRVHELDLSWSPSQIVQDVLAGVDMGVAFFPGEYAQIAMLAPLPQAGLASPQGIDMVATSELDGEVEDEDADDDIPELARPSYLLVFDTIEQRLRWGWFMKALRAVYPGLKEPSRLISAYLDSAGYGPTEEGEPVAVTQ